MIVATFSVSKIGLYWQQLGKMKTDREEKRAVFCPLAFVSGVVDVFFCGGVRMYVTQASSIFCAISFFFHTHTCAHTPSTNRGVYLEVLAVRCRDARRGGNAGPPQESAAICFISIPVNNGGGVCW